MEFEKILELIHAVKDSNLTEFHMQDGDFTLSMVAEKTVIQQAAPSVSVQMQPQQEITEGNLQTSGEKQAVAGNVIKSPLVGTYYEASSPESEPFVKVGDSVKKGQVLGIVEAMKLMNEIESEFDGTVKEILVKNEQTVEFGQPMFVIG